MIELIVGPMFAGKTECLLDAIRCCVGPCKVFKPACDTRDDSGFVVSHSKAKHEAIAVQTAGDILQLVGDCKNVFIDEVQFFGPAIISVCRTLEDNGVRVVCSGLDMDSNRLPFGCIGDLMAIAGRVTKLVASCEMCGCPASYSHRNVPVADRVFIGGEGSYMPLCGRCWGKCHE